MGTQNPVTYINFSRAGGKNTIAGNTRHLWESKTPFWAQKTPIWEHEMPRRGNKKTPVTRNTCGNKKQQSGKKDAQEGNRQQKIRSPKGTAETETQYQPEQQEHNIIQQATHPEPEPAPVPSHPRTT